MTVGQRIAQRRRELGLSQEALGERLGVSRQAIYKWESDAALPEIEKLVNLSREFSVSIDWLLGEEDEARGERKELTPEQLRMVEEIVGRYLAAQPKPAPVIVKEPAPVPKRRRWPWMLAGAVLVGVFFNLFSRLDQLNHEYQSLQNSISIVSSDVNSQIYSITNRVEEVLQSQNSLTAEQSAEVTATDYRANTVTISARAVPRTYVEGMSVEFLLVSDGKTTTVTGERREGHAYTAEVTVPLSDEITVSVALVTGEQRETQVVNQFEGLYERSLVMVNFMSMVCDSAAGGWFANPLVEVVVFNSEGNPDEVELKLGLFRDRKLVAWYTPVEEFHAGDGWRQFTLEVEGRISLEPNVPYCLAAMVTDQYGRTYMCSGGEMKCNGQSAQSVHGLYSADPADWGL